MKKILGIGNALVDILVVLEDDFLISQLKLPRGSRQVIDRSLSTKIIDLMKNKDCTLVSGGSAANSIYGLSKLGIYAGYIGKVGDDRYGNFFESDCLQNGVHTLLIKSSDSPSGFCISLVSPDGERTMATFLGASCEMASTDITNDMFEGYDYFHVEGYVASDHDFITDVLKRAHQKGLKVSLDLASYNLVEANLDFFKDLIVKYVDIVFANEEEAKTFTGLDPESALDEMAKLCEIAIVKVGSKGSFLRRGSEKVYIKPFPINRCMDTTGAGDLYASGFLYGLARGCSLEQCGNYGSIVSGNIVQVVGARLNDDAWDLMKDDLRRV
jgi:sugar/nucleoside kinase (ribokinase family)